MHHRNRCSISTASRLGEGGHVASRAPCAQEDEHEGEEEGEDSEMDEAEEEAAN